MSCRARAVPGHGHPAIHNIPPFWACLVSPISTSYPLQLCLKASRDVPKVFNSTGGGGVCVVGGGGFLDLPHSGSTTEPWLFCFTPPHLFLSLSLSLSLSLFLSLSLSLSLSLFPPPRPYVSVWKKSSLTRGTFSLAPCPVAPLSGEDNTEG